MLPCSGAVFQLDFASNQGWGFLQIFERILISSFCVIQSPILGEHLVRVFPPTLVILDDWENDNKILGCRLMNHLVDNVVGFEFSLNQFCFD
jgi:hypothetical protein